MCIIFPNIYSWRQSEKLTVIKRGPTWYCFNTGDKGAYFQTSLIQCEKGVGGGDFQSYSIIRQPLPMELTGPLIGNLLKKLHYGKLLLFSLSSSPHWVNRCLMWWKQQFCSQHLMQSEQYDKIVTDSFGQYTKGYNTLLSKWYTADNFPSLSWRPGIFSLWSRLSPHAVKWEVMWLHRRTPCV